MKLKGVSAFEQHVEKIVLVSVAGIFLIVIALQLLVQPNTVTVGQTTSTPGRAYDRVTERANDIRARMQSTEFVPPEVPATDLVTAFRQARTAPVAPVAPSFALGDRPDIRVGEGAVLVPTQDQPIAVVSVPPPTPPVAHSFWSTIDPGLVASSPEIAKLVPAAQPFDKVAVSCEVRFDGTALHKALQADPDGDAGPARGLPVQWYRDGVEVVALRLEREEQAATGEWTGLTQVPLPPGALDLAGEFEKEARSQGDLGLLVNDARRLAEDVRRPEFYRTIAGDPWVPPSEARRIAAGAAMPPDVQAEFRKLEAKKRELDGAQKALDRTKEPPKRTTTQPTGGGRRGSDPARQPDTRTDERDQEQRQKRIADAEAKVKKLNEELTASETTIRALGYDPETRAAVVIAETPAGETVSPLLDSRDVQLWAHDVTAEPGKTYRYRARVVVNNPVFGRGASLVPAQQDLARGPVLVGEPSEWSSPIAVLGEQYFFITSASEAADIDETERATAEVFRMFYGFYRKGLAPLEPGDTIAADVRLPEAAKLPVWDLAKLKAPAQPAAAPPSRTPPTRGAAEDAIILTPPQRSPTQPAEATPLPEGATPWSQPVRVALDIVLLDVAKPPTVTKAAIGGQGTARPQAFLRDATGRIMVRVPDNERTDVYDLLAESAKKGETQGEPPKPKVEEDPAKSIIERRRRREAEEPPGGSGGGGGGGGGGG